MPKICEKCSSEFPFTKMIDGKLRNFKNRRFCLECSPFGSRNTRKLDIIEINEDGLHNCAKCNIRQERDNFFTKTDGRAYSYCKVCSNNLRKEKFKKVKEMAVEYKGGCCEKCGYSKYLGALEFHHKDPTQKDFSISANRKTIFDSIKPELDKCMLLCANCHRETHGDIE